MRESRASGFDRPCPRPTVDEKSQVKEHHEDRAPPHRPSKTPQCWPELGMTSHLRRNVLNDINSFYFTRNSAPESMGKHQGCIKLLRLVRPGWVPIAFSQSNPAGWELVAGGRSG